MRRLVRSLAAAALLALLAGAGCRSVGFSEVGPTQTVQETIELQGAEVVAGTIAMGAGELSLSGGASSLMDASFTYNLEDWAPEVSYSVSDGQGDLVVRQPETEALPETANVEYDWDIRLGEDVPMALDVSLGAGTSNLDLSQINLRGLRVQVGAGEAIIILTGDYERSFDVSVSGGVGEVTLLLSNDVGARVTVRGGLGSVEAAGFTQDGSVYTNDAYGTADVSLNIIVEGGVGQINLQLVE
ncbi:MAG TPA: toast rack family protein [Aggregatilineales bacterium]|nr:toast rack family protein [Aggregatilineales bacterium]